MHGKSPSACVVLSMGRRIACQWMLYVRAFHSAQCWRTPSPDKMVLLLAFVRQRGTQDCRHARQAVILWFSMLQGLKAPGRDVIQASNLS